MQRPDSDGCSEVLERNAVNGFAEWSPHAFGPLVFPRCQQIEQVGECKLLSAKLELCNQNELLTQVHIVESGFVKLVFVAPNGSEHILGLRGVGYIAGLEAILKSHPKRYAVVTTTPV